MVPAYLFPRPFAFTITAWIGIDDDSLAAIDGFKGFAVNPDPLSISGQLDFEIITVDAVYDQRTARAGKKDCRQVAFLPTTKAARGGFSTKPDLIERIFSLMERQKASLIKDETGAYGSG